MLKNKLFSWIVGFLGIALVAVLESCSAAKPMGCPMNFTQTNPEMLIGQDYATNYNPVFYLPSSQFTIGK